MPRTGAWAGFAVGLAGVALAGSLTGCGGWDAPGRDQVPVRVESGGDAVPAPQPGPSATAGSGEGLRAGDFVLRPFPEAVNFLAEESTVADFTEFSEDDFAACLGVQVERVQDRWVESAFGPLLYDELSEFSLTSSASIVSEATLANDREVMLLPQYPRCFADAAAGLVLDEVLAAEGEGSGVAVEISKAAFVPTPPGATARIATVLSMVWPDGTSFDIYYDVITVIEGRVEATVHASGGEPYPEDVVAAAVAQVVEKVDNQ